MTWDTEATAAQREDERKRREWWARWERENPAPRPERGKWFLPAWTGPDSPQSPVRVP